MLLDLKFWWDSAETGVAPDHMIGASEGQVTSTTFEGSRRTTTSQGARLTAITPSERDY